MRCRANARAPWDKSSWCSFRPSTSTTSAARRISRSSATTAAPPCSAGRLELLTQVAIEEVDHDAIVRFALFASRRRHTEATQRQIGARLDVVRNGKTLLYRRRRIFQRTRVHARKQQHSRIAHTVSYVTSRPLVELAKQVNIQGRA